MKKFKNRKVSDKNASMNILRVIIGTFVVTLISIISLLIILKGLSDSFMIADVQERDKYCNQLADTLYNLANNDTEDVDSDSDVKMVSYISNHVEASGSSWSFLIKDDKVIFAKNESTTKSLGTKENKAIFMEEIEGENENALISTAFFNIGEVTYEVGTITDKEHILDKVDFSKYMVYLIILFAMVLLLAIAAVIDMTGNYYKTQKSLNKSENELIKRNKDFQQIEAETDDDIINLADYKEDEGKRVRFRQYKFKFYLNARHAIYIDGNKGETHPHTWEITLNVIKNKQGFIEFNKLEKEIEAFINGYQSIELNTVKPFDVMNPTLENCCNYFKEKIADILENEGWSLLLMEMSETPSRSYVVSMIEDK